MMSDRKSNSNKLKGKWNLVAVIISKSSGMYPQVVYEEIGAPGGP